MKYPLRNEYDTAVRNLDKFVFDDILKSGNPVKQTKNNHLLRSYNGGKAIVYEVQANTKRYALKCWVEDLGDLKIRYKEIDGYLNEIALPYFVDFAYKEDGILVGGQKFPIVRMEWVDGISFKRFITNNISNPVHIRNLAEQFLEMVKVLHQNNISHGDLQHGNIMIRKNGDICLIDYDSLYVPQLMNEKDNIKGLPGYQHPHRNKITKLSPKVDYFSELVIYLSLLAISIKPSYWKNLGQEERLFFSEVDLLNPRSSPIFAELKQLSPEIEYFTTELEKFCKVSDIESLQPLENIVAAYTGSKASLDLDPIAPPNMSLSDDSERLSATQYAYTSNKLNNSSPAKAKSSNVSNTPTSSSAKAKPSSTPNPTTNSSPKNVNSSNIWDKLDANKPNTSVQFDESLPVKNVWDKFDRPAENQQPVSIKNENIWNKFFNSISSVWRKFVNLFMGNP
jgi:serine/threonine protein kinase